VIGHELAHLARGDATRAARSARFVEGLRQALDRSENQARGPLGAWARLCDRAASWLIRPIAWGQEARADRSAAAIAGGSATASALVKVAVVQPLFREVLEHYDPASSDTPNLYAFFRSFWYRLPAEVHSAMRLRILAGPAGPHDPAHPPLPERLALLQAYPDPVQPAATADSAPATSCLGDLEGFEQMLHNRLFGLPPIEPSVFHKAGT
jgi:Zn-dependent protease with chaperone function